MKSFAAMRPLCFPQSSSLSGVLKMVRFPRQRKYANLLYPIIQQQSQEALKSRSPLMTGRSAAVESFQHPRIIL